MTVLRSTLAGVGGLVVALALVVANPAGAQEEAAEAAYERGVAAFRAGEYAKALEHFQRSRSAGMDSAALYFNLGSTYYRLGRLDEAEAAFRRAAESEKLRAISHYNLGLIARARGERARARDWFESALTGARTDKLRRLARRALGRDDAGRPWLGYLELSAGYDDNAVLASDELAGAGTGESDTVFGVLVYGDVVVAGTRRDGLRVHGLVQADRYNDLDGFDLTVLEAGATAARSLGKWDGELGVAVTRVDLGGDAFERIAGLSLEGSRSLAGPGSLELRYRLDRIDGDDPAFDFLDGTRQDLRLRYRHRLETWRWDLDYTLEVNDRDDRNELATSGDFFSFSPVRHRLTWDGRHELSGPYSVEGELGYRLSDYRDPEVRGNSVADEREDDRVEAELALLRDLGPDWRVGVRYRYVDNDSNFPEFSYERNLIELTLDRVF